jgi:hypothetical protein
MLESIHFMMLLTAPSAGRKAENGTINVEKRAPSAPIN